MIEEILDTEIRVIGENNNPKRSHSRWWMLALIPFVVLSTYFILQKTLPQTAMIGGGFDGEIAVSQPHPLRAWFESLDTITRIGTVTQDIVVNDIPLRIYVPIHSTPRLEIGYEVIDRRKENILLFQAADVRADNGGIVGAFVLRGEPLSWGLSKKGYCGIIDNQVSIGVADNSPLFEEATERMGYFFRQYPLVDNGVLVENELQTQSIRRGLCDLEGHVVVVESLSPASLHDFAEVLVNLGTTNAIYLVGSTAIGWSCDLEGNGTKMGLWDPRIYENVSFIVWSR